MEALSIFAENSGMLSEAYGGNATPLVLTLLGIALVELVLKGFALWRAARMQKLPWFIAILIINSAGILPVIYLLMTQKEYKKFAVPKT